MARLSQLIPLLAAVLGTVVASPVSEPQIRGSMTRDEAPLTPLARRHASGYQPRHLRLEDSYSAKVKRDSSSPPDVGQIADFGSGDPQPIRGALGATFLSNSLRQ